MDKYIKFGVVMEYLRNRCDEARQCGHEETYFDLLTIIDGLKNVETVPVSTLGKDIDVPTNSALDHIHNVVRDDAYKCGYEQAKAEYDHKLTAIKNTIKDYYYIYGYEKGRKDAAPKWIPFKTRPLTEEEKEEYPELDSALDCELPDDGQRILVNIKYKSHEAVWMDEFYTDDGFYLDSGYEIGTEATAWMPLPEQYKEGEQHGQTD